MTAPTRAALAEQLTEAEMERLDTARRFIRSELPSLDRFADLTVTVTLAAMLARLEADRGK